MTRRFLLTLPILALPRFDRAQELLRQFYIAPGALLSISNIERMMLYMQLHRVGLIDNWTLLEGLEIPNVDRKVT